MLDRHKAWDPRDGIGLHNGRGRERTDKTPPPPKEEGTSAKQQEGGTPTHLEMDGKERVATHHQGEPFRVLDRQYSFDENGQYAEDNGSENMIIHGDNLKLSSHCCPGMRDE